MKIRIILFFAFVIFPVMAAAQTTEFTYQGRLLNNNLPPTAVFDFEFRLFNAETGGAALGTLQRSGVSVSNGIFTVRLDFGAQFDGAARFLEIAVRPAGGGAFTNLSPRQPITSAPYSIRGSSAANSLLLGGIAPSGFIQNTTSPQTANFNISGSGTIGGDLNIGGTFNTNILNAHTQYNFGGNRILTATGNQNLFAGINSGTSNTSGQDNTFVGNGAGLNNTIASQNTFVGSLAGQSNTNGSFNSFFGMQAGNANTNGSNNAFFGAGAGLSNTAGGNSFFGRNAGSLNTTGTENAFFGFQAGSTNVIGQQNSFFGYNAGAANNSSNNAFFGFQAGRLTTTGCCNAFFGSFAGTANTTGSSSAFFGYFAGSLNTASNNSFFGSQSGDSNTTGGGNSFFGANSGDANTSGGNNSFFGVNAGTGNTTASFNSFFGAGAGLANTIGGSNSFFGITSGQLNTSGNLNAFFGSESGKFNTTGDRNAFFGAGAGNTNSTGNSNTLIGAGADIGSGNLSFATAIGADAVVSQTDAVVLGRLTANVGIGVSAPQQRLHIRHNGGNILFGNGGCNPGFAAIGFSTTLNCANYSLLGDGSNTIINRSSGGVIAFRENNVDQMTIDANGIVSINTLAASGNTPLCRNASFNLAVCSSSLRYKENVQTYKGGLEIVRSLRPVTFNWKNGGMFDVGFAAEEVEQIEPLLATRNDKGEIEGVKYAQVSTVLVNSIKEQQEQIEAQAAQIERQQKQIQQQQTMIDALRKLVCLQNTLAEICKQ